MKVKELLDVLNLKLLTKDVSEDALYAEVEGPKPQRGRR